MKKQLSFTKDCTVIRLGTEASAPLDPKQLGSMAQDAEQALLRQGESENTLRSYRSALRYWAAWFALRYRRSIALPVEDTVVLQFIVDHVQRLNDDGQLVSELPAELDRALVGHRYKAELGAPSLNTVIHRISVLSKMHQLQDVENPCAQPRVRDLLAKARRGYAKRGDVPDKKPALTREPLDAILATCDNSLTGLRDHALLLFAFSSGGRRRSEVTAASMENTHRDGDCFIFTLSAPSSSRPHALPRTLDRVAMPGPHSTLAELRLPLHHVAVQAIA